MKNTHVKYYFADSRVKNKNREPGRKQVGRPSCIRFLQDKCPNSAAECTWAHLPMHVRIACLPVLMFVFVYVFCSILFLGCAVSHAHTHSARSQERLARPWSLECINFMEQIRHENVSCIRCLPLRGGKQSPLLIRVTRPD